MYTRHQKGLAFRLPERLAEDAKLSSYAKQLALVLFSLADQRTGAVCNHQRRLATLSGMSVSTVNKKLRELEDAGYLTVKRQPAYFDWDKGRLTRKASVYICNVPKTGYLLIPYRLQRKICGLDIHGTQVAVFLFVFRMMRLEQMRRQSHKKEERAYPSFSMIAKKTGHVDSTVRAVLKVLDAVGLLYIQRCLKHNGAFSCNSYFLLHDTVAGRRPTLHHAAPQPPAQRPCFNVWVYADIQNNRDQSKITGVLTREERTIWDPFYGISQYEKTKKAAPDWHRLVKPCSVRLFLREKVGMDSEGTRHSPICIPKSVSFFGFAPIKCTGLASFNSNW